MTQKVPIREGIWVESGDGGRLLANRCVACGQVFFPRASVCFTCFGEHLEDLTLSRRGKLYSYTIAHMPASHFRPPYAMGLVDMPEGVRVFAPLKTTEETVLTVGMDLELAIEELWQEAERAVVGYKFQPV